MKIFYDIRNNFSFCSFHSGIRVDDSVSNHNWMHWHMLVRVVTGPTDLRRFKKRFDQELFFSSPSKNLSKEAQILRSLNSSQIKEEIEMWLSFWHRRDFGARIHIKIIIRINYCDTIYSLKSNKTWLETTNNDILKANILIGSNRISINILTS